MRELVSFGPSLSLCIVAPNVGDDRRAGFGLPSLRDASIHQTVLR